jgi:hypothetical protein
LKWLSRKAAYLKRTCAAFPAVSSSQPVPRKGKLKFASLV